MHLRRAVLLREHGLRRGAPEAECTGRGQARTHTGERGPQVGARCPAPLRGSEVLLGLGKVLILYGVRPGHDGRDIGRGLRMWSFLQLLLQLGHGTGH